jgi:hypothetical protein
MNSKETLNEITEDIVTFMDEFIKKGVRNTPSYRLFLKILAQEALYDDPEAVAAALASNASSLPDNVPDAALDKLAKGVVNAGNAIYTAILEDVGHDKAKAKSAMQSFKFILK